jgi:hypothetical protein
MKRRKKLRKILVILSNRFQRSQAPRFFEIECDEEGNMLKEEPLRRQPRTACYDEVWENDNAKTAISSCNSFKRKYRHPLEKPKSAT